MACTCASAVIVAPPGVERARERAWARFEALAARLEGGAEAGAHAARATEGARAVAGQRVMTREEEGHGTRGAGERHDGVGRSASVDVYEEARAREDERESVMRDIARVEMELAWARRALASRRRCLRREREAMGGATV